jgi:glutathionylspermidine synthase
MDRILTTPRANWEKKVEEVGLVFHHTAEGLYWDESAYYRFNEEEVEILEKATNELHELCLVAVQHVIDKNRFEELGIPSEVAHLVIDAWEEEPPSIYGRFDFAYDGKSPPKLLEYNADTPTALLESSVVQWFWLEERFKGADQFNSIHEKLLAKWQELRAYLKAYPVYFAHAKDSIEDRMTVGYLQDTAEQAGIRTAYIFMEDIGWSPDRLHFVDLEGEAIVAIFKLYPWEWMIREEFGRQLIDTYHTMQWMEPVWKLVLSNKGILPILWELNPGHPNLLEAHFNRPAHMSEYVRKPLFSREGANIAIKRADGELVETGGGYGGEGFIYQQLASLPDFAGKYPVLGSWVIDGESAGIGIRETDTLITDNYSRFVPHLFE